ncbi:efflux RND transporter permease subunit [Spirochaeta isovalerica]|uniref:HAE1 family hydrophobic/amphiphilic exporter-1 n=1 Tax=Spirochaeta isovalerica TaxID=150 RepID=A0A841RCE7_9SPIO|nr:efflux RND transporter permease subunit [Spirochaeta isovalerica]MBB6481061.1 HAE1 family hydrophobic/amphiphilic exporter-1 [Spirochaeta isovalerica]
MSITRTVVNKPVTIFVAFVILIGLGLYISPQIPLDLYPEINPPILVVFSNYEGAGPEEVENTLTRPLEGQLTNVSNIKGMTSTSSEGTSMILLEFGWGQDISESANEVRDKLEFIKDFLPEKAGSPQIFKFDPSMLPILDLVIRGDRTPEELLQIAEDTVQPLIEQVEGVSMTSVTGGRKPIVKVEISANRLDAYGLTLTQVTQALQTQNIQIGAGSIEEGSKKFLIRTSGEFDSLDDIRNTVVTYKGGVVMPGQPVNPAKVIKLDDLADVTMGFEDQASAVYINGEPGVNISVQKQTGTNSVQTADNVIARLEEINKVLPYGVKVEVISDTTQMIRMTLDQVISSALTGAIFAMVILFIFLRSVKSTFIIGLSIPVSLLITLMAMYFFGLTLNLLTLTGLILGIGMIVDSSIVILENIYRYREKGAKLTASALLGTQEMIMAITASILTTICVFLPMLMFKSELDVIGVMFQDLAFTIVIALLSSLLIAITLVPTLAGRFIPLHTKKQKPVKNKVLRSIDDFMEKLFSGLDNSYMKSLHTVLDHKGATISIVIIIFAASVALFSTVGINFLPTSGDDFVQVGIELPVGTKLDVTEDVINQFQYYVENEIEGYTDIIVTTGSGGGFFGETPSNKGSIKILLPKYEERIETSDEIKELLRSHFDDFPSVKFSFSSGQMGMGGSASPIDVIVKSEDLKLAGETAIQIRDLIQEQIPEVTEPTVSLNEGLPQIEVNVDREKAYALGLNIYSIGSEISANIDGKSAGIYRSGGDEFDIKVLLEEEDRKSLDDLNNIFIMNQMGEKIPVSNFATLERTTGPTSINREDQSRVLHVTGGLKPGASTSAVEAKVRDLVTSNIVADDNVIIDFGGDWAQIMEMIVKFLVIMVIAVALVFAVMASQFESLLDPFIIFLCLPLMAVGVIWIYIITGTTFSMFTAVGLVMLAGIVVNNGIVLVDYTNLLRERGLTIREACVQAGGNRLRPILMTTLTTILGMVPMAFFPGEGSELVQPIGLTVIGGLTVNTLGTLYLVPVLYSIFNRKHKNNRLEIGEAAK